MAQDPQTQDPQTGPGWDSPGATGTTSGPVANHGFVDDVKLYWRKVMDTSILEPLRGLINSGDELQQQIIQNEVDHAHPIRAALAKANLEINRDAMDMAYGMTTPKMIGLALLTGGESIGAKALAATAGLYFGWRGSQQMLTGHQAGETRADEIRRRSLGLVQAVAGAAGVSEGGAGVVSAVKGNLRASIQNNLGLSGDLAATVQAKVELAQEAEAQAAKEQAAVVKTTKSQVDAVQAVGQGTAASAAAETPIELNKIMAQASQAVAAENARFESEYTKLNEQAKAPVTTAEDLKAEIVNSIKARGVQDEEIGKIKNKIFAALPAPPDTTVRAPTSAENTASQVAANLSKGGMNVESIRAALVNQGYVPTQVDTAMSMAFPHLKPSDVSDVSFEMSRRVKNDLWGAAQSATDSEMRNGLYDALKNVDGIRQRYADAQGFGPQHTKLNAEYMKFKRELGSGTMDEFLKANDFADQNSILLTAKNLINQDSGEALRGLLDLAGVDTTPLKAALDEHKAFAPLPEQALPEIIKQAEAQSKQIDATKNQAVTAIGETNPIIPGKSDLALAGKGNLQIRLDAMRAIANNAKKSGITNAGAYIQIMWGTARLLSGSPFGGFSAASGGTRLALEKMLRSKSFQDYVAQESGVTAEAMPKFRRSLSKSLPYLEKIALSTAAAGGLNQANQKKSQPIVMPTPAVPAAPAAPATNKPIGIAGVQ